MRGSPPVAAAVGLIQRAALHIDADASEPVFVHVLFDAVKSEVGTSNCKKGRFSIENPSFFRGNSPLSLHFQ